MKAIHKYLLKLQEEQTLAIPEGYEIIHCGMQNGWICLWAIVPLVGEMTSVKVKVFGTGQPMSSHGKHIGTVQHDAYVWHVFYDS